MKFWIVEEPSGETLGCERTKRQALELAASYGYSRNEISLSWVDVDVNAETIRRLLSGRGGYANDQGEA
jgi:hypothetical protein